MGNTLLSVRSPCSYPSPLTLFSNVTHLRSAPIFNCTRRIRFARPSMPPCSRSFSTTPESLSWLQPKRGHKTKSRKGRPRVPTGGSTRGTTVVWGDWGLRMKDHDRRVSAAQLSIGAETIKKRLRGLKYRFYTRVCANIGVYTSGNEMRMGKGKGSFDYWASRVAVSKILFEVKGDLHERVVRDAFRLAASKMPGMSPRYTINQASSLSARPVRICEERGPTGDGYNEGLRRIDHGRVEKTTHSAYTRLE